MKSFFLAAFFAALLPPVTSFGKPFNLPADSVAIGQAAPDFHLKDISGNEVSLASLKGKVVVVDFWATWCVPCHENFPATKKIVDHYKNDGQVVFLFIDTREKSPDYVNLAKADMEKNHYDFQVIFDEAGADGKQNKYYALFGMMGIPTQFMIDKNGVICYKFVGYDDRITDDEKAKQAIKLIDGLKSSS